MIIGIAIEDLIIRFERYSGRSENPNVALDPEWYPDWLEKNQVHDIRGKGHMHVKFGD